MGRFSMSINVGIIDQFVWKSVTKPTTLMTTI